MQNSMMLVPAKRIMGLVLLSPGFRFNCLQDGSFGDLKIS